MLGNEFEKVSGKAAGGDTRRAQMDSLLEQYSALLGQKELGKDVESAMADLEQQISKLAPGIYAGRQKADLQAADTEMLYQASLAATRGLQDSDFMIDRVLDQVWRKSGGLEYPDSPILQKKVYTRIELIDHLMVQFQLVVDQLSIEQRSQLTAKWNEAIKTLKATQEQELHGDYSQGKIAEILITIMDVALFDLRNLYHQAKEALEAKKG